jgi:molybdopterin-guanine dinucleotide biosynthesis protein A
MENQRVVLFVRIEEHLKNKLENAAKADKRSVNSFVEQILIQNFEVENEQNTEPTRSLREAARQ